MTVGGRKDGRRAVCTDRRRAVCTDRRRGGDAAAAAAVAAAAAAAAGGLGCQQRLLLQHPHASALTRCRCQTAARDAGHYRAGGISSL